MLRSKVLMMLYLLRENLYLSVRVMFRSEWIEAGAVQ